MTPAHGLEDGTYQVWHKGICAGFVIHGGRLAQCAPILRRRISYWMQKAKRISTETTTKKERQNNDRDDGTTSAD
jgi:DNA-nicking Smr family endonuclease